MSGACHEIFELTDLRLDDLVGVGAPAVQPVDHDDGAGDAQNVAPKKRSRAKKTKPLVAGAGVVIIGNRFVCSYSGEFSERAVFVSGVDSACFRNLPCAFAFLEESGAPAEIIEKLKIDTAAIYEQPMDAIERAPRRDLLVNFGGTQYYSDWLPNAEFWDNFTERSGLSVAQYQSVARGGLGRKTAVKRGKGSDQRVSFEAAPYLVAYGKGAAGCQLMNALDATPEPDDRDASKTMSIVRALRKLTTFCNAHKDHNLVVCSEHKEGFYSFYVDAKDPTGGVPEKLQNRIAQQLLGHTAFGPAVFVFTRKYSQAI